MQRLVIGLCTTIALVFASVATVHATDGKMPEGVFYEGQQPTQYLAADLLLKAKVRDADGDIFWRHRRSDPE